MKIGIGAFVSDEGIRPDTLARAIEERGFENLIVPEHSHTPVDFQSPYPPGGTMPTYYRHLLDPFVVLSVAAAVTTKITLGTGVTLLIQRDVIQVAKEVASIDLVSNGRMMLGVSPGWMKEQMSNHGTDPATRGALLEEKIQALRAIWANDEAEFHGNFIDFDPIYAWPKPVRGSVPIYVGGFSPPAFARVKSHGDGWMGGSMPNAADVEGQMTFVNSLSGGKPTTIFGIPHRDVSLLEAYAEQGVERLGLLLEPASESETLALLDEMAPLIDRFTS
jgi:probable F420-dependent oxidoreductase